MRALALLVGLSVAAALGSARLLPADWRVRGPSQVFSALRQAVQGPARSARPDSAKLPEDKVKQPPESESPARQAGPAAPSQGLPAEQAVSPELAALAMARGDELMRLGDVASARRFYELAATTGLPQAALAIAQTYDPRYLRRLGAAGLQGDAAKAARWYDKAAELGRREPR